MHPVSRISSALNIDDLAKLARKNLPSGLYEYIDRGAEDEVTATENSDSIKRILFRQRVGVDVSARNFSTTLFGVPCAMPLGIAATGLASMIDYDGERSLARAAAAARIPYTIGTSNFTAQHDLKEICGDLLWRLIYPPKRRDLLEHHLGVTRDLGIRVLVVTMDSPVVGNREYLQRSGFNLAHMRMRTYAQMLASPHWLFGTLLRYLLSGGLAAIRGHARRRAAVLGRHLFLGQHRR
jgi:isopentenyl diphosphate isomerase/L-lactate dehydrogenase-like FMN-dependent dehydrogenase